MVEFTITLCLCPVCKEERSSMYKFCSRCGTRLIVTGLYLEVDDREIKTVRVTK